jgi:uncharacterized membrane protein YeaQ/YmgE (transglycosylase-associated protein family)
MWFCGLVVLDIFLTSLGAWASSTQSLQAAGLVEAIIAGVVIAGASAARWTGHRFGTTAGYKLAFLLLLSAFVLVVLPD